MDKMKGARAGQSGNAKTQPVPTGTTQITGSKRWTRASPYLPLPRSLGGGSSKPSATTLPVKNEQLLTQQPIANGAPATQLTGLKKTQ